MSTPKIKPPPAGPELAAFRKLEAGAQIAHIRGQVVERAFTFERDSINKEERTAWLSIASETPYERWWGIEILDMQKKSIRQDRLKNGLAILVDHVRTDL